MSIKLKHHSEEANEKVNKKLKIKRVFIEEKIHIFEKFKKTGKQLTGNTVFEGYPIGNWAIQIRADVNAKNKGKNSRRQINLTKEQLDKLYFLGILDRQIEAPIDEKIEMLVQWMAKYPKSKFRNNISVNILKEYATTEEEYLSIITQYETMQKYYDYIRSRKSEGKLTEEQISKCKEGNIRGVFGYPTSIVNLSKKIGIPEKDIDHVICYYGTIEHFIDLYRNRKLNENDNVLASSMIRSEIDIDLSPNSENYDKLYEAIIVPCGIELYSSKNLKAQLETLPPREAWVIERIYGLLSEDLSRNVIDIATEAGVSKTRILQLESRALKRLRHPSRTKNFCYSFKKSDMLTAEESRIIDNLQDNIYASNLIFRNNPHISQDDMNYEDILKAFELIKNMDEIIQKRENQRKVGIEEKINISQKSLEEKPKSVFDLGIAELKLSIRTYNSLTRRRINTLGDILQLTEQDLMKIRNLGKKGYDEIVQKLEEYGLALSGENKQNAKKVKVEPKSKLEIEDYICHAEGKKDAFIEDVLIQANKLVKAREKDKEAKKLLESYKELYDKIMSQNEPVFGDDCSK